MFTGFDRYNFERNCKHIKYTFLLSDNESGSYKLDAF
jgi:hypothetical protein